MYDYPPPYFSPAQNEGDLQSIAVLARDIWTEHYTPIIGPAQVAYMLERYQSSEAMILQQRNGMIYYQMRADDVLAGYAGVFMETSTLVLSKLYVAAAFRHRGYARCCLQYLIETHRPHILRLWVNKYNVGSIAAYQRLGFEIIRSECNDIGNGFVMDDFVMERVIDRPAS